MHPPVPWGWSETVQRLDRFPLIGLHGGRGLYAHAPERQRIIVLSATGSISSQFAVESPNGGRGFLVARYSWRFRRAVLRPRRPHHLRVFWHWLSWNLDDHLDHSEETPPTGVLEEFENTSTFKRMLDTIPSLFDLLP